MKERPILFSAPMVRAILDGRKTQTRRLVGLDTLGRSGTPGYDWTFRGRAPVRSIAQQRRHPTGCWQDLRDRELLALCPHGEPGDRLWVRETWAVGACADGFKPRELSPRTWQADNGGCWYDADSAAPASPISPRGRWRVGRFMPRWASRTLLDVTEVRVELLRAITEEDAHAEGVTDDPVAEVIDRKPGTTHPMSHRAAFMRLWDAINGDLAPWSSNPWVWVVSFARVTP